MSHRLINDSSREFINPKKYIRDGKTYTSWTFSRNEDDFLNIMDIAHCAELSFHKSLIGISELALLESGSESLRFAKAVQTYYVVYHLFVCAMLLDNNYKIIVGDAHRDYYEVDDDLLSSRSETPDQWNLGKFLEADLGSAIGHSKIRKYCADCRKQIARNEKLNKRTQVLYDSFIYTDNLPETKSIPGLYEKLDYIRDRAIYRPTYVIQASGRPAQTSFDVRKEIESLPSSHELFTIVENFFKATYAEKDTNLLLKLFVNYVQSKDPIQGVKQESKIVKRLKYTWNDLEKIGGSKKEFTVPPFICQMMELFEVDDTIRFYEEYWKPIIDYAGEY